MGGWRRAPAAGSGNRADQAGDAAHQPPRRRRPARAGRAGPRGTRRRDPALERGAAPRPAAIRSAGNPRSRAVRACGWTVPPGAANPPPCRSPDAPAPWRAGCGDGACWVSSARWMPAAASTEAGRQMARLGAHPRARRHDAGRDGRRRRAPWPLTSPPCWRSATRCATRMPSAGIGLRLAAPGRRRRRGRPRRADAHSGVPRANIAAVLAYAPSCRAMATLRPLIAAGFPDRIASSGAASRVRSACPVVAAPGCHAPTSWPRRRCSRWRRWR